MTNMMNNNNNSPYKKSIVFVKRPSPDYSDLFSKHGYNSIFVTPNTPRQVNYDKLYNLLKTMPVNLTEDNPNNTNNNYYWAVIITSQNASIYFKHTYENVKAELNSTYIPPLSGIRELEITLNRWMRLYYFVPGNRTALPLQYAFNTDLNNIKFKDSNNKEVLIKRIIAFVNNNKLLKNKILNNNYKVLILEGDKNDDYIYNKLTDNQIKCERLQVYETYIDKEHNLITKDKELEIKNNLNTIKYCVFFSPSGVDAALNSLRSVINIDTQSTNNDKVRILAIGDTTAKHLREEHKIKVLGAASKPTPEGILDLILY